MNALSSQAIMLEQITPVILTFDEEPNIGRTLSALQWAGRVIVVDSGSLDGTREIAESFSNVAFFVRTFDSHSQQWNFAISQTGVTTPWIMPLDADHHLTEDVSRELSLLDPAIRDVCYRAPVRYMIYGRPLRGALYPPVNLLMRNGSGAFIQDGHTQRWETNDRMVLLSQAIEHDDRKSVARWIRNQQNYMRLEAEKLLTSRNADLRMQDRLRMTRVLAPFAAFIYALFFKGAILDGRAGVYYAMQRMVAEAILSLELLEHDLRRMTDR